MRAIAVAAVLATGAFLSEAQEPPGKKAEEDKAPKIGEDAPDFRAAYSLTQEERKEHGEKGIPTVMSLKRVVREKQHPVVLVFGSLTCPRFKSQALALHNVWRQYRHKASFFAVYIREAHPSGGNDPLPDAPPQPKTAAERGKLALQCREEMKLEFPFVLDDMDNSIAAAYGAWPARIFIIDSGMKVAFRSEAGPTGFWPEDARKAFKVLLVQEARRAEERAEEKRRNEKIERIGGDGAKGPEERSPEVGGKGSGGIEGKHEDDKRDDPKPGNEGKQEGGPTPPPRP